MKRSGHIALVLMGATAMGASSYALMPQRNCPAPNNTAPGQQAAAVAGNPVADPNAQPCRESRRWGSSSYRSSSGWFWRSSSTSSGTATAYSGGVPAAGRSGAGVSVARGGFGGTGHAVSAAS